MRPVYKVVNPKKVLRVCQSGNGFHGLAAVPPMEPSDDPSDGTFKISLRFSAEGTGPVSYHRSPYASVGVVGNASVGGGMLWSASPVQTEMTHSHTQPTIDSWFLNTRDGALHGNQALGSGFIEPRRAGGIQIHPHPGTVITMELDFAKGTLRFWVNGSIHGAPWACPPFRAHYTDIPKISMQWALVADHHGTSVEIVDHPELESFDGQ
jgi:hypothetical protein